MILLLEEYGGLAWPSAAQAAKLQPQITYSAFGWPKKACGVHESPACPLGSSSRAEKDRRLMNCRAPAPPGFRKVVTPEISTPGGLRT